MMNNNGNNDYIERDEVFFIDGPGEEIMSMAKDVVVEKA